MNKLKIELEITEEDAACIWSNNHGPENGRTLESIVQDLVTLEARDFRRNFPESVESSVALFRKATT